MQNKILTQGQGEIAKISVDSIYGYEAFASKSNKKLYIRLLMELMDESVCLIAYCVLDRSAYVVVKGETKSSVKKYIKNVNYAFNSTFDSGNLKIGDALRSDFSYEKIKSDNLDDVIVFVHSLAPNNRPERYSFCSFDYLMDGGSGGTRIIVTETGATKAEFADWLSGSVRNVYLHGKDGNENFNKVLKENCQKYLETSTARTESALVFVIADTVIRTGAPYQKVAKKLGINYKSRHDLLIATLCEMIENRDFTFEDAYGALNLKNESYDKLMVETMVEMNRTKAYSYDYITAKLGYIDYSYDVLVNVLSKLHQKFGYSFEQMCQRFHLQNDIIGIRNRCGF